MALETIKTEKRTAQRKPAVYMMVALLLLLSAFLLSGCRQKSEESDSNTVPGKIVYTNLNNPTQQADLAKLLEDAGVSAEHRDGLMREIAAYNASVPAAALTDGWETADALDTKYDPYELQDAYEENNPDFIGYNCRITAFSVMSDYIATGPGADITSSLLVFDMEALKERPAAIPSESDRQKFLQLFAELPTVQSKAWEDHLKVLQAEWEARGILFNENKRIHLITVFFHDMPEENENILFAGHAGVLLETDHALYFLEKVAFQEPYRLLRLSDRTELNDCLMARYDVSWDQPTADPFILEDGELLDGYRKVR